MFLVMELPQADFLEMKNQWRALGGRTGPGYKARLFWSSPIYFLGIQNNLAYHPGPAFPPGGDGSPFQRLFS